MSITRHTAYNVAGGTLPLVLTLVTVPLYLQIAGAERYGILAICWALLGYLGFLDLGLGPAVAQRIAADGRERETKSIIWTALWISLGAGLLGSAVLYVIGEWYFFAFLAEPGPLSDELRAAMPVLALILPVVLVSGVLSGALQGRERFLSINVCTSTSSALMSILPLAGAILVGPSLLALLAGALLARGIGLVLLWLGCRSSLSFGGVRPPVRAEISSLLSFGSWITAGSLVYPFLATFDRLVIGANLGAAAVAQYTIPQSLVGRLSLLPGSVASALFPRFASIEERERPRLAALTTKAVMILLTPVLIFMVAAADPFFTAWIGREFAATAVLVIYALAPGVLFYACSQIPITLLQASGQPSKVTKLLMLEVIPYCALLVISIHLFGLVGAALTWTCKAALECLLLLHVSRIPAQPIRTMGLPALLITAASATGIAAPEQTHYLSFALLLAVSGAWSFAVMPTQLKERFANLASKPFKTRV